MAETIFHQWFRRVWNERDRKAVYELLAPDAVIHEGDENGQDTRGPEQFLAYFDRMHGAMPDMKVAVSDVVTDGTLIAGRFTVAATHTGDHMGFAATHRPIQISGMGLARINKQGQISEAWNTWDRLALMRQLGFEVTPQTKAAGNR